MGNQSVSQNLWERGAKGLWGLLRVARWVCADDGVSGLAEGGGGGGEVEGGLG